MMETFIHETTSNNFDAVLGTMILPENKQQEMVFSSKMIEAICENGQYHSRQFAHTPEGDIYMRMRIMKNWSKNITLEYIVMQNAKAEGYDSYVYQIFENGQLVYRRPDNPIGTIHVLWPN